MSSKGKGKDKDAKAAPAAPVLGVPASAHDPDAETAAALVGGSSDPLLLAWVLHGNPRHRDAIVAYLQSQHGMAFAKEVLDTLAAIHDAHGEPERDHSGSSAPRLASGKEDDRFTGMRPEPGDRLPYDKKGGWDALTINSKLGQHDKLAGTDSDGARCTFAVALAAQIMAGPTTCARWLVEYVNSHAPRGKGKGSKPTLRQYTAGQTLHSVAAAVGAGTATYGDLSWAQEALHAYLRADEDAGSDGGKESVVPSLEEYAAIDSRHDTAEGVMAIASAVPPGGRLIVVFDGLRWPQAPAAEEGATEATEAKAAKGTEDRRYVHQISIMNQDGALYLYDPDWPSGLHLDRATASKLRRYLDKKLFEKASFLIQGMAWPKAPATGQGEPGP